MATSSIVMLSNISMERLYLSQPPAWNDLQRLPFSLNQQQQDARSSQQVIRTCYDKLLHHMYDINSSSSTTMSQIKEQLELAAEYCQLKNFLDVNAIYLHSDNFYVQVSVDPSTCLPTNVSVCYTFEQQTNEESFKCPRMLKALSEKQYKLFREHLNGFASLFTLSAPTMNHDRRIGYTAYKVLQQDLEHLSKTDVYCKLLEGFQASCEGLPMHIKFQDQLKHDPLCPSSARIIIVPGTGQYYLPVKSSIYIDEKSNTIQVDPSIKSSILATGHFALEFDDNQTPFTFLLAFAQEIGHLTNINNFYANLKSFNYLSTILPKAKSLNQYQWYISHDQSAVSIRQIPFTNLKQLIHILNLVRQQIYLTKYLNYYFDNDYGHDRMDDDSHSDVFLELSFLSPAILSITCAQSYHLLTCLLQMSNITRLPSLINRQQHKDVPLTHEKYSLLKSIENMLKEDQSNSCLPMESTTMKQVNQSHEQYMHAIHPPKISRRLSCGPPAKPTWRRATTLRRNQPACLTLVSIDSSSAKMDDERTCVDEMNMNLTNETLKDVFDEEDDGDAFVQSPGSHHTHQSLLPRPSLNICPSTLSRCTSVSSTQSTATPPIFGLSPSTPYPSGRNNTNGNAFFPLGKQISVPDRSPVSSPIIMGNFDPLAFLPTNTSTISNQTSSSDSSKISQKKKRRRSDHSADDFIHTLNSSQTDNRSSMQVAKAPSSGSDSSSIKRGKKPVDKGLQQQQQQMVRQKSAFKVTDSPTANLLSQQSLSSSDDGSNELKPLKVVIKRVGDSGNPSNDEAQQQQLIKQRKKQQQQQQHLTNAGASLPTVVRKLSNNNLAGGSSPSVLAKSESLDMSQLNVDANVNLPMTMNDGSQQIQRERPRPSSSLANTTTSLSASTSAQARSAPPQPPIVLKIQRSKVYSGQDSTASSSSTPPSSTSSPSLSTANTTTTTTAATPSNNTPSALKEALKQRARSNPSAAHTNKPHIASPPLLAAKLPSPALSTSTNPILTTSSVNPAFRIPRKSSSQEVAAKPKTEPSPTNTGTTPSIPKAPLLPTPGVRPSPPPLQIGSWQSPPTQQPSRFHQNRPRSSWSQQQPQRGRTPVTSPNISSLNSSHSSLPNFSQQPRSILKKPSSNENPTSDLLYMPPSELPGMNEQRSGANFAPPPPPPSRTVASPGMYDDNDDDSSPQAQLVIDTSSSTNTNALLPYTIVPGSSSSSMDNYDPTHENNSTMNSSQQQHIGDDPLSNMD